MEKKFSDEKFYKIFDGSFSIEITPKGEIGPSSGAGYEGKIYLLIGRGIGLATAGTHLTDIRNDMILKSGDGSVVITNHRFVKKLPVCPNCNHVLRDFS